MEKCNRKRDEFRLTIRIQARLAIVINLWHKLYKYTLWENNVMSPNAAYEIKRD